jgi:hypothetical protein
VTVAVTVTVASREDGNHVWTSSAGEVVVIVLDVKNHRRAWTAC